MRRFLGLMSAAMAVVTVVGQECHSLDTCDNTHTQWILLDQNVDASAMANFTTELADKLATATSLTRLHVLYGNIDEVPERLVENNPNLEVLRLGFNQLKAVPAKLVQKNPKLTTLDLSVNNIESIPEHFLDGNPFLETLDLSSNRLSTIPDSLISRNPNLKILRLGDNSLSNLPAQLFASPIYLDELDIASNNIATIPLDFFAEVRQLTTINTQPANALPDTEYAPGCGMDTFVMEEISTQCKTTEFGAFVYHCDGGQEPAILSADNKVVECRVPESTLAPTTASPTTIPPTPPTVFYTISPTFTPTAQPTQLPTQLPTEEPTEAPSPAPGSPTNADANKKSSGVSLRFPSAVAIIALVLLQILPRY